MSETWRPLYKFDCTPRQLAEFQPRCAEYQTARESVLLAATPVLIIRVSRDQIELDTKVREDFTSTERALSWLKVPTSAFTFKTLC